MPNRSYMTPEVLHSNISSPFSTSFVFYSTEEYPVFNCANGSYRLKFFTQISPTNIKNDFFFFDFSNFVVPNILVNAYDLN
jgi:hypothetical protein